TQYYVGYSFKTVSKNTITCIIYRFSDKNCSISAGSVTLDPSNDSPTAYWNSTSAQITTTADTSSLQVFCQTQSDKVLFDQFYVSSADRF
ncbi:MAG TPA: hypothetical protein VIM14_09690, partial [Polyangia bacterium]